MRIHYIQHVPFEDLANMKSWTRERNHSVEATRLYLDEKLPSVKSFEWLILLGGPMNIYEQEKYPWLVAEKRFIEETINTGKFVLGICLGAQMVADVLGGKVRRNEDKEIGWLQVSKTEDGLGFFKPLPAEFIAFHWHGDTFEIPKGATRLAESRGCANQAFECGGNVLALQFHLESSEASIGRLIENCKDDLSPGKYVQTPDEISSGTGHLPKIETYMESLLDEIEKRLVNKQQNGD